eukprot:CAMPEP_0182419086 /NCGR_PEP_ID=MMETSP1167-20130531/3486_1 /TAXON_ID=2988 /ORGANISM="Mallomonas Sp, Strain CCMP3275" /LENGTH=502 /DNA_ID=CAMNT_0024593705 /DNA_START=485 /DNA_END=1993 /DNA_ORIENTATION=+
MAINFIMVRQKETKKLIIHVQNQIKENPKKGFWLVSFAAFIVSPFLTNDGVCLLFVEPILNAFDSIDRPKGPFDYTPNDTFSLEKKDAFYFLLSLACSANIGSALTYTGNPQNMIVGEDAAEVLPPYIFLLYMILPAISGWLITIMWVERCWMKSRITSEPTIFGFARSRYPLLITNFLQDSNCTTRSISSESNALESKWINDVSTSSSTSTSVRSPVLNVLDPNVGIYNHMPAKDHNGNGVLSSDKEEEDGIMKKVARVVISPFPYAMLLLMAIMIVLIFAEIMSIAGLVCVTAVVMVIVLVLGNHWQGKPILGTDEDENLPPLTAEEKIANTNDFFEELFDSIDYSLLLIFLGTFVVVENIDSTGIPKRIWDNIVGNAPFDTFRSVIGISLFVLISSQLLGNVAVVQLAKPNVENLRTPERKYAWAVISFVATVGGNFTITGSAANIIVAEKARRIDPGSTVDFFRHYNVCFWVTLFVCALGAVMITGISIADNGLNESW